MAEPLPNGTHVWAWVEYPGPRTVHLTINAVIESHSYGRGDVLRYRVRDHESGGVFIVLAAHVKRMS